VTPPQHLGAGAPPGAVVPAGERTAGLRFLVRAAVFVVLLAVALTLSYFVDPQPLGLVVSAAFGLVALVWGLLDGRAAPVLPAVVAWFAVALALGVVMPLGTALVAGEWVLAAFVDDTLALLPFILLLVFAPALLGLGIGAAVRQAGATRDD
jgi:hypothetical protein